MEIDFLQKCQNYSKNPHFVQGAGGNISFKNESKMFIKASGIFLKKILSENALSEVSWKDIANYHYTQDSITDSEETYLNKVRSFKSPDSPNPSMETGFHAILDKYVIHSHPTVVNAFLCSKEGREIISKILPIPVETICYTPPGQALTNEILKSINQSTTNVGVQTFLLENHGVIISSNDYELAFNIQDKLFSTCRNFIFDKIGNKISFDILKYDESYLIEDFLFPDQIVFAESNNTKEEAFIENMSAAIWIDKTIKHMGWTPNYISNFDAQIVANMKSEAERRKKVKLF